MQGQKTKKTEHWRKSARKVGEGTRKAWEKIFKKADTRK